jgi:predicted HAD superfamily Cof-like phosphohydrolase
MDIQKQIAELNLKLVRKNEEVLLENQQMAKTEHSKKLELFELQRLKLLTEMAKEIEPTPLTSVGEFHERFGHPILEKPKIPSKERAQLRVELLQEELNELKEAILSNDLVEVADAFSDLQYVLAGAILEFGMKDIFRVLFGEVHRSNMSKACNSEQEAQKTVDFYKLQKGEQAEYKVDESGNYTVYRTSDNKVLKSVNYSPANLKRILGV